MLNPKDQQNQSFLRRIQLVPFFQADAFYRTIHQFRLVHTFYDLKKLRKSQSRS